MLAYEIMTSDRCNWLRTLYMLYFR